MAPDSPNYQNYMPDPAMKLRDLEEKQRMMKNQLLLIGKNLIDIREKNSAEITGLKKDLAAVKESVGRLASFLETASDEFQKFARKDDVEILAKQLRMFRPFSGRK